MSPMLGSKSSKAVGRRRGKLTKENLSSSALGGNFFVFCSNMKNFCFLDGWSDKKPRGVRPARFLFAYRASAIN